MKIINLGAKKTVFNQFMMELRHHEIQKDSMRFRFNLQRIGNIMAYEISQQLEYQPQEVVSSLGVSIVQVLTKQPVLATIMRAGLPFHQGMLDFFDKAENAFISAYRAYDAEDAFTINFEYIATPQIDNKTVILSDPMLATGASMLLSYNAMLKKGNPDHVHIAVVIASKEGIDYVQRHITNPNVTLWIGAVDDELTSKSFIVPGLGDAGDLAYGSKY